ncbi:hypothetical protein BABINDRAFT_159806 [Babjeviella inositovora NRRL Y-12698]|uniref:Uncharacterized protein n=1 Tax=Babjeviella inositovora NRRL Y-12698 TaxID=984486 RepID=A0A1E3QV32_9ASCO|nr:uncharacterized protein BABINDRAFT_159806 [Babjeviella inositovora NRRL Y-12698]ODQ81526.1 hypothetical protein BABINDRAFT_159806 [Babjeviella inositovora NRRL Y-12698]
MVQSCCSSLERLILVTTGNLLGVTLLGTEDLLVTVLLLLSLLSRGLFNLVSQTVSNQSVSWLELLGVSDRGVDQTEPSRLTTTVLGSETKDGDSVLFSLVNFSQLFSQLILRDVSSVWVQDIDNELSSGQQWVGDNLSGSDGNSVRLESMLIRVLDIQFHVTQSAREVGAEGFALGSACHTMVWPFNVRSWD